MATKLGQGYRKNAFCGVPGLENRSLGFVPLLKGATVN
jgi:hypothetical protein